MYQHLESICLIMQHIRTNLCTLLKGLSVSRSMISFLYDKVTSLTMGPTSNEQNALVAPSLLVALIP